VASWERRNDIYRTGMHCESPEGAGRRTTAINFQHICFGSDKGGERRAEEGFIYTSSAADVQMEAIAVRQEARRHSSDRDTLLTAEGRTT
jgi:hypothetical protein